MIRVWLFVAGLGGLASVIAGAAAAHAGGDPKTVELLRNGSLYGMIHAAALLGIVGLAPVRDAFSNRARAFAGCCFAVGIVLFSLAQFAHALSGISGFAWAVPFGGTAFVLGWLGVALLALRPR